MFPDDNEKTFECDYMYCMFTSINGCKIELTIDFPNEDDKKRRRRDNKEETDEKKYEAKLAKFVIKRPPPARDNIVEDNIKKVAIWNRIIEQDRQERSEIFHQRHQKALKKKEKLFMQKIRHNIYYMNRWDIVREKRKDIEELQRQQERKELFTFWWKRQQGTVLALKVIFDIYNSTRTEIFQAYKEKLFTLRIIRRYNQAMSKRAPTLEDRTLNLIRMSQTASISFMKDTCEKRSKNYLTSFLKIASMNFDTKKAFTKYYEKIVRIQTQWRNVRESYEAHVQHLSKLWDKESEIMVVY